MAFGEAGTLTRGGFGDGELVRVDFTEPLTNAVIMLTGTNAGGNEYALTVTSIDADGFYFLVDEWEDEDGPHPATETINWLAVEPGVHTLPDGRIIEAGTTSATDATSSVSLNGAFTGPPVVLTNVNSYNETDVVDSDPTNITASGFDVQLQEGSLSDGVHIAETVGYVAISPGSGTDSGAATTATTLGTGYSTFGLGGTVPNAITLGETQTLNESDAGNVVIRNGTDSTIQAIFDEESGDGETAHTNETVGFVTFSEGLIMCFTPKGKVLTPNGERRIDTLQYGDLLCTRDHGPQPLLGLSQTHLSTADLSLHPELAPIRIEAGALGEGMPLRTHVVSPQHRVLISGWRAQLLFGEAEVLVPACALVNDSTIRPVERKGVKYVHLVMGRHQIVTVDGAPSESLHAGAACKDHMHAAAREELFTLLPDLRSNPQGWQPPARRILSVREGALLA